MVSTMKIAAVVSGASTGCGSGSGSGRATAGTCDHSVTERPFPADTKLPSGKVNRVPSPGPCRGHAPGPFGARDGTGAAGQHLDADAEDKERRQPPDRSA
jgi:hypothetical protein